MERARLQELGVGMEKGLRMFTSVLRSLQLTGATHCALLGIRFVLRTKGHLTHFGDFGKVGAMNLVTFSPLFASIVCSSLWREPDYVVKIFLTMIALKGRDHMVRMGTYELADFAKKTEQEVIDAIKILEAPDTRKLEPQPFEGRRVERRDGGWFILNGEKYQSQMQEMFRKARNAARMKKKREAEAVKKGSVPKGPFGPGTREQAYEAGHIPLPGSPAGTPSANEIDAAAAEPPAGQEGGVR